MRYCIIQYPIPELLHMSHKIKMTVSTLVFSIACYFRHLVYVC